MITFSRAASIFERGLFVLETIETLFLESILSSNPEYRSSKRNRAVTSFLLLPVTRNLRWMLGIVGLKRTCTTDLGMRAAAAATPSVSDAHKLGFLVGLARPSGRYSVLPEGGTPTCCTTCVNSWAIKRRPSCDLGANWPSPTTILCPTVYASASKSRADCSAAASECTRTWLKSCPKRGSKYARVAGSSG